MRKTPMLSVLCAGFLFTAAATAADKPDPSVPTADAQALIDQVNSAYDKLQTLKVNGKLTADLDVAGNKQNRDLAFVAEYKAPRQYRHVVKEEFVAGSTGEKLYAHELQKNVYTSNDLPEASASYRQYPGVMGELLEVQDPTLLLAVTGNGVADMIDGARGVRLAEQQIADGDTALPTLAFTSADGRQVQLGFDPSSKLLRQARYDMSDMLRKRGAEQVNAALISVQYTDMQANATFADDHFAWAPPANAREVSSAMDAAADDTTGLVGKPAPAFDLQTPDGKQVSLASLKGKAVLLDFWATWCPPCVKALPEIDALWQQKKDDVHVFALNVGEDKATIEKFMTPRNLKLPVLMDENEAASKQYKIRGIPTTVIITPGGVVHRVYVGMPPGGKAELLRELEAAQKIGDAK